MISFFDTWSGALTPVASSVPGHIGEPSVLHVTNDESCSPCLVKQGQEFLLFLLPSSDTNTSLQRSTEGYIEVIDMSSVTGDWSTAIA